MFTNKTIFSRLVPVGAIVIACLAAGSTAAAATISLGTPSLTAKIAVTDPVTVTCSPFDPSLTLFSESVNLQVEQAVGSGIAHGSGAAGGFVSALLFPCDGTPTTLPITVSADAAGPPFHGGKAVFTASVSATAGTPCFPGSTTCFTSPFVGQGATAGPTALNMH